MKVRFLLDEHLPAALIGRLKVEGHEALHVAEQLGYGASDHAVARETERLRAVLLTKDFDFVLQSMQLKLTCPIVWIRLGNMSNHALWHRLLPTLPRVIGELERGAPIVQVI